MQQINLHSLTTRFHHHVQSSLGEETDGIGTKADAILPLVGFLHNSNGQLAVRDGLAKEHVGLGRFERLLEDGGEVLLIDHIIVSVGSGVVWLALASIGHRGKESGMRIKVVRVPERSKRYWRVTLGFSGVAVDDGGSERRRRLEC